MRTHRRYASFPTVALPGRNWPDKKIDRAPRWLSTDLRDGNQALAEPMSPKRKAALFELLTDIGYREIEVGFPAASKDDHEFVRMLIEEDRIPDDVRISVLVPARAELVRATARSLVGAPRATMHLYNATSPLFRDIVLGTDRRACKELAVRGTREVLTQYEKLLGGTDLGFQYSPEIFNETELDFALEICEAVMDLWQPGPDREIILNFPATVERSTPNVFADKIEWINRNLYLRVHVCHSIHPPKDRVHEVTADDIH